MSTLKIWFPEYATEAHRKPYEGASLVSEFLKYGIECYPEWNDECQLVFCANFMSTNSVLERAEQWNAKPKRSTRGQVSKSVPIVHYAWDIYPFQVNGDKDQPITYRWELYNKCLREHSNLVIVPSKCTIDRIKEFTGRDSVVVKSSVRTFNEPVWQGDYVLDAMRNYPDPNAGIVVKACSELEIPCFRSNNNLPWKDYKHAVAGCRFLVSAQYEASTGGLSALEAYALGKPVLLSGSPRHGGIDYFGSRATYFQWDNFEALKNQIRYLWDETKKQNYTNPVEQRHWVETEYSEDRMAMELAQHLRRVAGLPERTFHLKKHIAPYHEIDFIDNEHGYIVWRTGTGDNLEILHIRSKEEGKGNGIALIKGMLKRIEESKQRPYHSVFVFTKSLNDRAVEFYYSIGMTNSSPIDDLYQETAILFTIPYTELVNRLDD